MSTYNSFKPWNAWSVCSGIGGLDLGFERAGGDIQAMCEFAPYQQSVLNLKWPKVKKHSNLFTLKNFLEANYIDRTKIKISFAGLPCQPFSDDGLKLGENDPRYLVNAYADFIEYVRPRWVVVENVKGFTNMESGLDAWAARMERIGYSSGAALVPASAVGAPHQRYRCFVVSNADGITRLSRKIETPKIILPSVPGTWNGRIATEEALLQSGLNGICYGLRDELLVKKLQAYGNAVVPDLAYVIFSTLIAVDRAIYND